MTFLVGVLKSASSIKMRIAVGKPSIRQGNQEKIADIFQGATQIRTGGKGFADLCLTTWRWRRSINIHHSITVGSLPRVEPKS